MTNLLVEKERTVSVGVKHKKKVSPLESLPQANDFDQIVKLVRVIQKKGFMTSADIEAELEWHPTHANYYLHGAAIFGLIDFDETGVTHHYFLTEETKKALSKGKKTQNLFFIRKIMTNDICKYIARIYLDKGYFLTNHEVRGYILKKHPEITLADTTIDRRISTLNSWAKWAVSHMKFIF